MKRDVTNQVSSEIYSSVGNVFICTKCTDVSNKKYFIYETGTVLMYGTGNVLIFERRRHEPGIFGNVLFCSKCTLMYETGNVLIYEMRKCTHL